MTDTTTRYTISSRTSGLVLGTYAGETEQEALDALARYAGYADHAEACQVTGEDGSDLLLVEVTPPESLDELLDVLLDAPDETSSDDQADYAKAHGLPVAHGEIDTTRLPTFGGDAPASTVGVWSWDAGRLLVGDWVDALEIVSREDR